MSASVCVCLRLLFRVVVLKPDTCTLIEIKQDLPGFDRFIGSWVYQGDLNLVVDVGPANSADSLIETLENMDLDRVDYILLTHIHIDHAGGLAKCLERFPMARVVCHEKGIKHLVDPTRLWEGSRKVLAEIAEAFGPPGAVKHEKFISHTEADIENLDVIDTPGHAAHHLCFDFGGHLFAGEAGGNYCSIQGIDYLRPATPPRFFLEVFLKSIDRLRAFEDQHICYAHWGDAPSSHEMLERFREQILRWKDLVQQEIASGDDDLVARCVDRLLEKDPDLKAYELMEPDVQKRERYFLSNSVRGYIGFLKDHG
jgi:glyoxylase-like metal-dependent hydrolase (beta-lactamase superfamily II)